MSFLLVVSVLVSCAADPLATPQEASARSPEIEQLATEPEVEKPGREPIEIVYQHIFEDKRVGVHGKRYISVYIEHDGETTKRRVEVRDNGVDVWHHHLVSDEWALIYANDHWTWPLGEWKESQVDNYMRMMREDWTVAAVELSTGEKVWETSVLDVGYPFAEVDGFMFSRSRTNPRESFLGDEGLKYSIDVFNTSDSEKLASWNLAGLYWNDPNLGFIGGLENWGKRHWHGYRSDDGFVFYLMEEHEKHDFRVQGSDYDIRLRIEFDGESFGKAVAIDAGKRTILLRRPLSG